MRVPLNDKEKEKKVGSSSQVNFEEKEKLAKLLTSQTDDTR
jgi:hypothetical protein